MSSIWCYMGYSAKNLPDQAYGETSQALKPRAVAELVAASKSFGAIEATKALNLRIAEGEFLSFLGPSGCGKTTALRIIAGFETPTSGDVLIDGKAVNQQPAYERPVNMVFQNYALFPHLTVSQNIAFGLRQPRPRPGKDEIREKVARALETVRLPGYEDRHVWEMSGGQQQRVALARAIVNQPKILLLDEPLAALDRKLRKEMQVELQDLQRKLGITFILVTHDQEEALSLSDRICVMRAGEIVQIGSPQQLYDRPLTRYVADFVGSSNFFDGTATAIADGFATVELASGKVLKAHATDRVVVGQPACVCLRPEQVRLHRGGAGDGIEAVVQNRIFLGEHTEYVIRAGALGSVTVLSPGQTERADGALAPGDAARISWDDSAALALVPD